MATPTNKILQLPFPEENAKELLQGLVRNGITNKFAQAAILAVSSKETGLVPKNENLNYSKERLPEVWGVFSDTAKSVATGTGKYHFNSLAASVEHNPEKIAAIVYGGKHGNNTTGDGFKYRGRAYNGVTFRNQYLLYGNKLGIDFVAQPDLINVLHNASDVAALYFLQTFIDNKSLHLSRYGVDNVNGFRDLDTAVESIANANAGMYSSRTGNIYLEGLTRAKSYAPEFARFIGKVKTSGTGGGAGTGNTNLHVLIIAAVTFGLFKTFS